MLGKIGGERENEEKVFGGYLLRGEFVGFEKININKRIDESWI